MKAPCLSRFSVVWMGVVLLGAGVALARDVSGGVEVLEPGTLGWLLDRYGPWGAALTLGWRGLGILDKLLHRGMDLGQALVTTLATTTHTIGTHVDRLLTAAEKGTLRVVVEHRGVPRSPEVPAPPER